MTIKRIKNEIEDYEIIYTWADQYSGIIVWLKYDFDFKCLTIVYRLDDNLYEYRGITLAEYNKLRTVLIYGTLGDENVYMEKFKKDHKGEAL